MDIVVQPPTQGRPLTRSEYPLFPDRSSPAILEELQALFASGDIRKFREVLDSLLSTPIGPKQLDTRDLWKVLLEAIERDDVVFAEELLKHGFTLTVPHVSRAIDFKAKGVLEVFFRNGWDINRPTAELAPPVLGKAVEDEEMVSWLLDHGADPNQQCLIDLTPLSCAVERGSMSTINLMFRRGGDIKKGQLLHHAVERQSETIEVVKLLLEKGAPINATMYQDDYNSWRLYYFTGLGTVLHKAAELGKVDVVRFLLSEGVDPTIKDANNRTALEWAENLHQSEVVDVLRKWTNLSSAH